VKRLNRSRRPESWVIYRSVSNGAVSGPCGVCEQAEWEAMERTAPGGTFVIQSGIADEGMAERLARGASGDPVLRVWRDTESDHTAMSD
jgi:hypothetical protein